MKIIELKCPSCGGGLKISSSMDRFACGYCGSSLAAVRLGGTVSLGLIGDAITKVQIGTDRTAAELTLRRLSEELSALADERISQLDAWREIDARWAKQQNSIRNSGGIVPIFVAAFCIGAIVYAVVNAVVNAAVNAAGFKIPDLGVLIGFLAGFTAFGFFLFSRQRKIENAVASLNQRRDHEFASHEQLLSARQCRMDAKREKQDQWRRIVDS